MQGTALQGRARAGGTDSSAGGREVGPVLGRIIAPLPLEQDLLRRPTQKSTMIPNLEAVMPGSRISPGVSALSHINEWTLPGGRMETGIDVMVRTGPGTQTFQTSVLAPLLTSAVTLGKSASIQHLLQSVVLKIKLVNVYMSNSLDCSGDKACPTLCTYYYIKLYSSFMMPL